MKITGAGKGIVFPDGTRQTTAAGEAPGGTSGSRGGFPRPAYDSGWVILQVGGAVTLTHNLGGDPNNYLVDLQFYHYSGEIHDLINNCGLGGDQGKTDADSRGGYYCGLNATSANCFVRQDRVVYPPARLRIWVYE